MPLYYHYSNEPSICNATDSTHVQYINDTLHIIRSVFKPQLIHNTKYAKIAIFCCSLYMSAGIVLLPHAPLLSKHAYWLSATAIWMLAGPWLLNQHAADLLPLNIATQTAGMVSHY